MSFVVHDPNPFLNNIEMPHSPLDLELEADRFLDSLGIIHPRPGASWETLRYPLSVYAKKSSPPQNGSIAQTNEHSALALEADKFLESLGTIHPRPGASWETLRYPLSAYAKKISSPQTPPQTPPQNGSAAYMNEQSLQEEIDSLRVLVQRLYIILANARARQNIQDESTASLSEKQSNGVCRP